MPSQNFVIVIAAAIATALIYAICAIIRRRRVTRNKPRGIGSVHAPKPSTPDHTQSLDLTAPICFAPALAAARDLARDHLPGGYPYLATSSEDIDTAGRASSWEVLFAHRRGTAIVTIRPADPDSADGPMHAELRIREATLPEDRPPLPDRPIDSPEAIRALTAQGADLYSSTRATTLFTARDGSGRPVWRTEILNARYETPLAA